VSKIKGTRFAQIPEWVLDAAVCDRSVRLYGVLARVVATDRQELPPRRILAERLGCSVDSLDRALKELEGIEAVEVIPRRDLSGDAAPNDYVIHFDPPEKMGGSRTHAATPPHPRGQVAAPTRGGGRVGAAVGNKGSERTKERTTDITPLPPGTDLAVPTTCAPAPSLPAAFEAFYAAYPRHEGKLAAAKVWSKAVAAAGGDTNRIISGAMRYRTDPNRDPSFTAHPGPWLNAGRWDDDPLPARNGRAAPPSKSDQRVHEALEWARRQGQGA
jgi:hypothetical protein